MKLIFLYIQPISYKRYFRCNNCFLHLVYTIHLLLSTNLVDPPPMGTIYMKHPLFRRKNELCHILNWIDLKSSIYKAKWISQIIVVWDESTFPLVVNWTFSDEFIHMFYVKNMWIGPVFNHGPKLDAKSREKLDSYGPHNVQNHTVHRKTSVSHKEDLNLSWFIKEITKSSLA